MNTKDLIRLGVPVGEPIALAHEFIQSFIAQGKDGALLEGEIFNIVANPPAFFADALRAPLARAIYRPAFTPRAELPPSGYAASRSAVGREALARGAFAPWRQWGEGLEAEAVKQMANACALPVAVAGALMPDAHVGYGLPIGGVLATDNAVIPYAVGVDIACRMKLTVYDRKANTLAGQRDRLANLIESETRFGMGCTPPEAFVQAGSLAIYGNAGERWCDEEAPHGTGFPVEVCERWEEAFGQVNAPATRKSVLRIGFTLGRGGVVIDFLARLTRWFLGGHVGNGRQFISWIHVVDLNQMLVQCIEDAQLSGAYNATSPDPVTNAEFMHELRRVLRRPWSPPIPAPIAHLGAWLMGTEASLALTGRRCTPRRFIQHGLTFEFPNLRDALADIYPRS